jgi:5-methylcytosine-specific restriction endonuclease McrA
MPYKDPAKKKEYLKEYYEKNKEKNNKIIEEYRKTQKQNAYDSIAKGIIVNHHKWGIWCNKIKNDAKQKKHPYSIDFTNDVIFEMMIQGCFYCGDFAITVDRIDSTLDHTPENCVGCCKGCNISKGAADPTTFIKKAYYRVCEDYVDDDSDIWFVNKTKPSRAKYKSSAKKKGVLFELTTEDWNKLIKGNCVYCKRSPITWFGVDRVIPSKGYVIENVVSCCFDCNVDKLEDDVENMMVRNKRIVDRVISGELVIPKCDKVILHKSHKTI